MADTFDYTNTLQKGDSLQNGKYKIIKGLGKGGFGITYMAKQTILGSTVAVKEMFLSSAQTYCTRSSDRTVSPQFDETSFAKFKTRFNDEAKTIYRLQKIKGVVQVTDTFEENDTAYFVMEFAEGKTLKQHTEYEGKLPVKQALKYTASILATMGKVHEFGILHRDIKPDNIIITPDDEPVLIDFGIARDFEQDVTMTHTGFRTPGYAAPEQSSTKAKRGAYTDIYSIGATLYFMLTGQKPESIEDRNLEGLTEPKQLNGKIPTELNAVILKALSIKPASRYQYCNDMLQELAPFLPQAPEQNTLAPLTERKADYAELFEVFYEDQIISDTERRQLRKRQKKLQLTDAQCTKIEQSITETKPPEPDDEDITVLEDPETELWETTQQKNTIENYKAYLKKYPNGKYKQEAQNKIKKLFGNNYQTNNLENKISQHSKEKLKKKVDNSHKMFLWFFISSFVLSIIGLYLMEYTEYSYNYEYKTRPYEEFGIFLLIIAAASIFTAFIFGFRILHTAWKSIQDGNAFTKPGKAVGYLFIPYYNLYWIFIAYRRLFIDMNNYTKTEKASVGYATFVCIVAVIPYVNILNLIFMPILLTKIKNNTLFVLEQKN